MVIDRIQATIAGHPHNIDLWQTVDMVELLLLAGPSCRARVSKQLQAWLMGSADEPMGPSLFDDIFQQYVVEDVGDIEAAWLARQAYSRQPVL
jgi:hypothetical protein